MTRARLKRFTTKRTRASIRFDSFVARHASISQSVSHGESDRHGETRAPPCKIVKEKTNRHSFVHSEVSMMMMMAR